MVILKGEKAKKAFPYMLDSLKDDLEFYAISSVEDIYYSKEVVGHLFVAYGKKLLIKNSKVYAENISLKGQAANKKVIGTFIFIGTNVKYFNHFFNTTITGYFTNSEVFVDYEYYGSTSYYFLQVIKHYIINILNKEKVYLWAMLLLIIKKS